MTPVLVFDIETVPDVAGLRVLYDLDAELTDAAVATMAFQLRRQATGNDFLQLHLHRVLVISCALRDRDNFKVWSLGANGESETEVIQRFFDGIEKYTPQIVSWNGGGFDLPVLHYRALVHGVQAPRYWETGGEDQAFRWNNYLNRFHERHTDLMDVLAGYEGRASAPLHEIATLLGFPGKLGMAGGDVWERWLAGDIQAIRDYCETDVLNTYLVFLRFQMLRGRLTESGYATACRRVRDLLQADGRDHLRQFDAAWGK